MTPTVAGTWFANDLVAAHARDAGDLPALVDGEDVVTWAALDARVDAVATMVRNGGVAPGDRVAILAEAQVDVAAAILGVLRAGGVAAPVPRGLTGRERLAALGAIEPALILRAADLAGPAPAADLAAETPLAVLAGQAPVAVLGAPAGNPRDPATPPNSDPRDPEASALIVLTSGTTGRPKGVVLSARAMAASADAWLAALPPATGWALPLGLAHVAGLGILWRAIARRVPIVVVPPADPLALLRALRSVTAPSHVSLVPGQLLRLLDATGDAPPPATVLAVPLGGGAIPAGLVLRAIRAGWPVVPTYGLSEMGSGVTALDAAEAADAPGTAGRPLPGLRAWIEDPEPDGVGEIVVAGPSRCSGYLGEPAVPAGDPLRTGDLGRLDEAGRLVVVERRTDRIVRGGENIAPAEVEEVLRAHPAVAEAAVVGRPDERWGAVPVAAVVLVDRAADPGDEALAAHARASLSGFKVPAAFVRLDALPRTPGGKLRRAGVRALLSGERTGELARPDGDAIGWRLTGGGPLAVVLLHGTLSTAAQLDRLAGALAVRGDVTVHALDRRGSGTSRLARPRPLDIAVHVADVLAYLDARGIERAAFVGISFGGVLALELAARHPGRASAVAAYEPPYGAVADAEWHPWFVRVAEDTAAAHARAGSPAAAETFLRWVAGDAAWDRLPARARAFLEREGDGALADAALDGLEPEGLARITARVAILTGDASEPFYAPIADELARRIPGARRLILPGTHTTPITDPAAVADAVRALLELPA